MAPSRIWIESLGCAKNQVDSEVMLGLLSSDGFVLAESADEAEVIIVNTCGFIEAAVEESIDAILEAAAPKSTGSQESRLIVAGCLYQRYGAALHEQMPEVDAFVGCGELQHIGEICRKVLGENEFSEEEDPGEPEFLYDHETPRTLFDSAISAYVKIAEGCDNRCSYCLIPALRGSYRSRSEDSVVKEVRGLIRQGVREINLIAQDTTHFGVPEAGEHKLPDLLRKLDEIRGKKWLRVLYTHPVRITNAVARAIGDSRSLCHYIDMPIQHISSNILKKMSRKGDSDDIRRAIDILRDEIPEVAIRTTLMVGFPGETDENFEELVQFVREIRFDRLGVFRYSREQDTVAARMRKQVPEEVKIERYDILMGEQAKISRKINRSFVGKRMEALIEGKDDSSANQLIGRTYRDAPEVDGFVRISYKGKTPPIGEFVHVEITKAHDHDLEGKLL